VNSRRRFWVIVAVAAGVALLVLGRPGADAEPQPSDRVLPEASAPPGASARPAASADRTTTPAGPTEPAEPVEPHQASGVEGDEALDPSAVAGALRAAEQFAAIWATSDPQWYDRLAALSTSALAASLADAEPPPAPGYRITGDPEVYFDAPEWARIGVPADRGTVVVDVVVVDRHWLVSAVDWRPS
jgi:hypothetical protein